MSDNAGMNNTSALIKHFIMINGLTEILHSFKYDRYNQCYVNDTPSDTPSDTPVAIYSKGCAIDVISTPAFFTHIKSSTTMKPHYKAWIYHWLGLFGDTIDSNMTHACIRYSNSSIRSICLVEYFVFEINRPPINRPIRIAGFSFTRYNDDDVALIAPLS